ncbi:MAG: hypothetical protein ACRDRD_23400, partial [Pseudonocardiaceae bacterium]
SDGEIEPTGPHSILQFPPLLCPPILDPARLIADFRLEPLGARVIADRDVYRARGTPRLLRPDVDIWDEFDFDAEHATVLRRAMGEAGRIIAVTEAIEVLYDNKIEPGRFDFGLRP